MDSIDIFLIGLFKKMIYCLPGAKVTLFGFPFGFMLTLIFVVVAVGEGTIIYFKRVK